MSLNRRRWLALAAAGALTGLARAAPGVRTRSAAGGRPRVLIVGGGFAGSACALQLRALHAEADIALIDPAERYATCPMSNEVIAQMRDLRSIVLTRTGLRRAGVHLVPHTARSIDPEHRRVTLDDGATLRYDRLVVAPGIRFLTQRIEGYDEAAAQRMPHAWKAGEQTRLLAQQLVAMSEGGVVAISVPAGLMRCPPAPYERASLIAHYLKQHKPRSKILILDANNSFPRQPLFNDAWSRLYGGMIEWVPMTQDGAVVRVDASSMTLWTASGSHRVAVANVIPPQAPGELAPASGLASEHGWCPIEPASFESTQVPRIHVIGDACIADAMPKSASAAVSQARQCAAAIAALLLDKDLPAPAFDSVCYSRLSSDWALALHGQFELADGRIVSRDAPAPASALDLALAEREVRAAADWYRTIRREAFGADAA